MNRVKDISGILFWRWTLRGKKDIAVGLTLTIPIPNSLGIGMSGERPRKKN